MTGKPALIVAFALAILHIAFACVYASVTPYRTSGILLGQRGPDGPAKVPDVGAPDERQHVNYVIHLLDGKGFPVLDPKDPELGENYQSHQPPLFYLLEAGWVKITGTDLTSPNSGLMARFLNTLIGGATVLGAFFFGLWGFKREDVGMLAAAFVALLPMNCALSGAVSNDPLLFCLCTWVLAVCGLAVNQGWTIKLAGVAGLLTGLAVVTKTTGIALLPLLLVAAVISKPRPDAKTIVTVFVPLLAVALPWLFRNKALYGDFLAVSAFNQAFTQSPQASTFIGAFGPTSYWFDWVGWWTVRSFFGAFGYMDIFLNERGTPYTGPEGPNGLYRALLALLALAFISWLIALRKPEWKETKPAQWLSIAFAVVVVLLFLRFNAQYFQGQARYLFPAISCFGVGVAVGILNIARDRWKIGFGILALLLVGLNLYAFTRLPEEFRKRTGLVSSLEFDSTERVLLSVCTGNAREERSV